MRLSPLPFARFDDLTPSSGIHPLTPSPPLIPSGKAPPCDPEITPLCRFTIPPALCPTSSTLPLFALVSSASFTFPSTRLSILRPDTLRKQREVCGGIRSYVTGKIGASSKSRRVSIPTFSTLLSAFFPRFFPWTKINRHPRPIGATAVSASTTDDRRSIAAQPNRERPRRPLTRSLHLRN